MSDDAREPELEDLCDLVTDVTMSRIRGFEIGQVIAWDAKTQSVSVQPVVKRQIVSETGRKEFRASAPVSGAPVWFFGAGGSRITSPPNRGDYGLILYCSVSVERWKRSGGVVDPGDARLHSDSDAIFVPGIHPLVSPPTSAPTDALVLHGGPRRVKVGGDTGTQHTLMADSFLSALDLLLDAIHTAVDSLPGGTAPAIALLAAINAFKSALVRDAYVSTVAEVK